MAPRQTAAEKQFGCILAVAACIFIGGIVVGVKSKSAPPEKPVPLENESIEIDLVTEDKVDNLPQKFYATTKEKFIADYGGQAIEVGLKEWILLIPSSPSPREVEFLLEMTLRNTGKAVISIESHNFVFGFVDDGYRRNLSELAVEMPPTTQLLPGEVKTISAKLRGQRRYGLSSLTAYVSFGVKMDNNFTGEVLKRGNRVLRMQVPSIQFTSEPKSF